jgi:hypothetical protein
VATDNTGFEPDHPDFSLYKNTRFQECYNLVPDAQNCSAIRAGLSAHSTRLPAEFGYVDTVEGWATNGSADARAHPPVYDWCQIASCFNGYKIIPSTARPSATILPDIVCWWTVMFTSASALVHTGQQLWAAFRNKKKPCRGIREISWLDWIFFAYDMGGPILLWWVSFGLFASDPAQSATIALTAWVSAWKLGSIIKYHPYSCALSRHPRAKLWLPRAFNIMAFLQWAGGVYIMVVYLGDLGKKASTLQGYDCLASDIAAAPGTTSCSAAELCAKDALFKTIGFTFKDTFQAPGPFTLIAFFWLWTLMALMPFFFLLIGWVSNALRKDSAETRRKDAKYVWGVFNVGPHIYLALASSVCVGFAAAYAVHMVKNWEGGRDREGPFMWHEACHALHVPLSPWRNYLDVSEYARDWRIVKMAFTA